MSSQWSLQWSLPVAFVLTMLAGCAGAPEAPVAPPPTPTASAPAAPALVSGLFLQNFDRSVRPQDDLYRFANGTWLKQTEIPADRAEYGKFGVLQVGAEQDLRAIAESAADAGAPTGTDKQLIGDFYRSFMDEAQAEKLGLTPIEAELARIDAIKDRGQLLDYLARIQLLNGVPPFDGRKRPSNFIDAQIMADAKDPGLNTIWVTQGGFALPEREYYFSAEPRFKEIRAAYEAHIAKVLQLAGRDDAAAAAKRLMTFETGLAKASWSAVQLRDLQKLYKPFSVRDATAQTPGLDWSRWFAGMGMTDVKQIVLAQPDYFAALGKALRSAPLATWKDHLRLRAVENFSPYLSSAFVQEDYDFYARTLTGSPQLRPRWKRALIELEESAGDLLGKEYVSRHFPPESKRRMDELVGNLLKAFDAGIGQLDWMGPETRAAAEEKIRNFTVKIGYPDKWKEYPGLVIKPDDLVGNVMNAHLVNVRRELAKIDRPVDKTEWIMTPQTVNAYYNQFANEIVFPAAILQPPFFNAAADDAVNYGGIGGVIGHEISHGFDDQGRKFDAQGVMRDWWTAEDNSRFEQRAAKLVEQYSAFSPLPGLNVKGELTLGENIGDLSGLAVAHKAYLIALGGKPAPEIDGFSGEQRFYLGWAQIWGRKYRDDELRKRLLSDPHSPAEYRANGVVRNSPDFDRAFDVRAGDKLYLPPDQQVRIW